MLTVQKIHRQFTYALDSNKHRNSSMHVHCTYLDDQWKQVLKMSQNTVVWFIG